MSAARVRVRRYKPKGSDLWVVCIHESDMNSKRAEVLTLCRQVILRFDDSPIAGFALVVWDEESFFAGDSKNYDGKIPRALIPDFVRNCLLAENNVDWTIARVRRMMGWSPPDAS